MNLFLKTEDEAVRMREGGQRLATVLAEVLATAKPGVSTLELDALAEKRICEAGGTPVFKGYNTGMGAPFPGSICSSVNNEVVHGIPKADCILREGDILKVDIGMRFEGMVTDMARTIAIGTVSKAAEDLLRTTEEALLAGITTLRPGSKMLDYAQAVERVAKKGGYGVVKDLVGHSVGRQLHENVQIPNYVTKSLPNFTFQKGMTVALEPMINEGTFAVDLADDDWTFVTADGKLSAHFEDTVFVTENGYEILTRPKNI
jgi:methionyl aminopeptidase